MTFEDNLREFEFNWETLNLLQNDNWNEKELNEWMNQVNFNDDLNKFLLTSKESYVKSVLLRLKLYNKQNKTVDEVLNLLSNNKHVHPLVKKLFTDEHNLNNTVTNKNHEKEQEQQKQEEQNLEKLDEADKADSLEDLSNNELLSEEDPFDKFFNHNVEETNDKNDVVKSNEFYSTFREWYTNEYSEDVPSKKQLKSFLNDKLGKSKKSSWTGIVLKSLN